MGAIITQIGLEKIANATANEPLRLEKFAVGDGNGKKIIPNSEMKSLVNEKYRDLISDKYTNGNNTVFESVIKATAQIDEGFYIRELGLFDEAGDLIVIADLPAQYRPASSEGSFVTELLFNVAIQVHNSSAIEIKINEQLFATIDSAQRLLKRLEVLEDNTQKMRNRVEILESNNKKLIESSVGIEKWFNTDHKYKDWDLIKVGIKMYALMDESNILKIADYPLLFKNINGVDRGDGTFAMPKFYEGTLKHLAKGNIRALGSFEEDEIKSHGHGMNHDHNMKHDHDMSHQHNHNEIRYNSDGFLRNIPWAAGGWLNEIVQTFGGRDRTGSSSIERTSPSSKTVTDNSGGNETRMKNTSGQWYLLAKIDM